MPAFVPPPAPVARGLRIGLFGGSFNPAHDGHVHASVTALKQLGLDYVWWLVSPQNPLKAQSGMAALPERLAAARRQAHHPRIVVTDIEARLGTIFTADTLRVLRRRFPHDHFVWLMGSDNLVQIPRWRRWRDIFRAVPIAVVTRPKSALSARFSEAAARFAAYRKPAGGTFATASPPAWTVLEARRNPASATALRSRRR